MKWSSPSSTTWHMYWPSSIPMNVESASGCLTTPLVQSKLFSCCSAAVCHPGCAFKRSPRKAAHL
eukprot:6259646-Pyramimonas_sp.AAC.1